MRSLARRGWAARTLFAVALAAALGGCAKHAAESAPAYSEGGLGSVGYGYGGGGVAMDDYVEEEVASTGRSRAKSADFAMAPPPPPAPPPAMQSPSPAEPVPEPEPEAAQAPERMVHYEGYAQLRVANPVETLDAVVRIAEANGGRTETLAGTQVSVRVPVAKFESVYQEILGLGDVMAKSIRADDVTDAFLAVDLRVANLRTTRDRLVELLAKATDENEKLRLIGEITRVTEELDAFESQLRTLSDLAAMSRISVDAVAREAFTGSGGRPEMAGFEWIRSLAPFNRAVWLDDKRVALPVPEGLVGLSKTGPFSAESADGVVFWTMRLANDPVGDAAFWTDAIDDRLADQFANARHRTIGRWSCLELDQPGADEPYRWQICTTTTGNKLDVAQVYFPSPALVTRYGAAVDASLSAGGES